MKKQILIVLSVITCLLAACSTANFAYYDDIYTSSSDEMKAKTANPAAANAAVEADSIIYETDENGNLLRTLTYYPGSSEPVVTTYMEVANDSTAAASNYAYDPDDYYDYAYASRIRRFHSDVYVGWGYYDPFFTNMYWYDYCPASFGLSIYLGYNWWWPGYYYRPYYYGPCWYSCGFNYGWGWYRPYPYYAWDPYYPGPYGPHGPAPIDWYHNNHDPNHSYYYGHRNNIGPSVGNGGGNGNGGRGERPDHEGSNGPIAGGYGNGATNNHYSSTPTSFNQRYDQIAGTTGGGSSFNNSGNGGTTSPVNPTEKKITNARNTKDNAASTYTTVSPANGSTAPSNTNGTSGATAKPVTTTTVTSARTSASANSSATPSTTTTSRPTTVTRTVVTPSGTTARPTTTRPTATRPSAGTSTTTTPTTTAPRTTTRTVPSTTTRPTTTAPSSPRSNYNRPSSSNSRPATATPSRSNSSTPATNRPASTSSRPSSYSAPSSSSRSSYSGSSHSSSGSSRGGSYGGGSYGGGHSGGSHSGGRR